MAKMTISIGKGEGNIGVTAAKTAMRERATEVILAALAAEFGEDAAAKVRFISESTGKGDNCVAAIVADITEDGGVFDGCITVKVTVKQWCDRVGTKTVQPAWDFEGAREAYDAWVIDERAKAEAKAAKAKADAEARAKRKAEAEARKAAKK